MAINLQSFEKSLRAPLAWSLFALAIPATGEAQLFPGLNPCQTCAPPPRVVPMAPVCPQVQTTLRAEPVVTYQPVTRTQIRRESYAVDVPVTTQRQVTVDAGGYQMVWVPKMVTKTVAETHLQRQVHQRDVPYQVVEQVPRVSTRLVPQQTLVHMPPPMMATLPTPGCCQPNFAMAPPMGMAVLPTHPGYSTPHSQALAPIPTPAGSLPQTAVNPSEGEWTKVPQRNAQKESGIELQSYQQQSFERVDAHSVQSTDHVPAARGMFSRPSASVSASLTGRVSQ